MWREVPPPTRPPEVPGTASPWLCTGRWCPGSPSESGRGSGCCWPGSCPRASVGRPELGNSSWNPRINYTSCSSHQAPIYPCCWRAKVSVRKPCLRLNLNREGSHPRTPWILRLVRADWLTDWRLLFYLLIYCTLILGGGEQADVSKLSDWHFDLLDGFVRIILETNVNYRHFIEETWTLRKYKNSNVNYQRI